MATYRTLGSVAAATLMLFAVSLGAADAFRVEPAESYAAKQSQAGVTLAVKPYHTEELAKQAFGKAQPGKYGILPVLVVISNQGSAPLKLERIHARYVPARSREGVEAMTAEDLFFFNPKGHEPKKRKLPGLGNMRKKVKKGPLARQEFADREFSAPVLPPGESASGFFYFNIGVGRDPLAGASVYVAGIHNMATGQDLFFFEVGLGAAD